MAVLFLWLGKTLGCFLKGDVKVMWETFAVRDSLWLNVSFLGNFFWEKIQHKRIGGWDVDVFLFFGTV